MPAWALPPHIARVWARTTTAGASRLSPQLSCGVRLGPFCARAFETARRTFSAGLLHAPACSARFGKDAADGPFPARQQHVQMPSRCTARGWAAHWQGWHTHEPGACRLFCHTKTSQATRPVWQHLWGAYTAAAPQDQQPKQQATPLRLSRRCLPDAHRPALSGGVTGAPAQRTPATARAAATARGTAGCPYSGTATRCRRAPAPLPKSPLHARSSGIDAHTDTPRVTQAGHAAISHKPAKWRHSTSARPNLRMVCRAPNTSCCCPGQAYPHRGHPCAHSNTRRSN